MRAKARRFVSELEHQRVQYFALWFTGENPPAVDFQFRITHPQQIAATFHLVAKQDKALQVVVDHLVNRVLEERAKAETPAPPVKSLILP